MTTPASLGAAEQRTRDRLRAATATLAARIGTELPQERSSREPLATPKTLEQSETLAFLAEALVRLAEDVDAVTVATGATKGARR